MRFFLIHVFIHAHVSDRDNEEFIYSFSCRSLSPPTLSDYPVCPSHNKERVSLFSSHAQTCVFSL